MKNKNLLLLISAAMLLSACTMTKPPAYDLPSAEGVYPGEEITVGRNENLYGIAQKHGVRLREIIVVNELQPPFVVKPGQKLYLPTRDKYTAPTPKAAPLAPVDKGPLTVSRGTPPVKSLGEKAAGGGDVTAVPLDAPKQPAKIPSEITPALQTYENVPAPPRPETAQKPTTNLAQGVKPKATTDVAEVEIPALNFDEAKAAPKAETAEKTQPSGEFPAFAWPVRGTVISAFGPKGQGLDNDGINIAAPKGSPVTAADSGMVAYAGSDMKGFGNLVLVRHQGGWVTAYAHLERVVVVKDSVVAKGEMIGTVGTTGGVSTPQLHFESRRDGKPVDPELVLK